MNVFDLFEELKKKKNINTILNIIFDLIVIYKDADVILDLIGLGPTFNINQVRFSMIHVPGLESDI